MSNASFKEDQVKGRDKRKLAQMKSAKRKGAAPCKNKPSQDVIMKIAGKVQDTLK